MVGPSITVGKTTLMLVLICTLFDSPWRSHVPVAHSPGSKFNGDLDAVTYVAVRCIVLELRAPNPVSRGNTISPQGNPPPQNRSVAWRLTFFGLHGSAHQNPPPPLPQILFPGEKAQHVYEC